MSAAHRTHYAATAILAWLAFLAGNDAVAQTRGTCPAALTNATKLVTVIADDAGGPSAKLSLYERSEPGAGWTAVGGGEPAVVGLRGVAWGTGFTLPGQPAKAEGDRKAPAGIYSLGRPFGHGPTNLAGYLKLEADRAFCVDDPASPHYNRIVTRAEAGEKTSGEKMWSEPLYRRGIAVDYPADRAAKAGSCIFIHVWREAGKGTAGCVALPEASVARLQSWIEPGRTAIAILARGMETRFSGCLP